MCKLIDTHADADAPITFEEVIDNIYAVVTAYYRTCAKENEGEMLPIRQITLGREVIAALQSRINIDETKEFRRRITLSLE